MLISTDVRLKKGLPQAVTSLILLNVYWFVVQFSQAKAWGDPDIWQHFAWDFADPSLFKFFISSISHANPWHLLGNMLYFWVFASILEDRLGMVKILLAWPILVLGAGLFDFLLVGYLYAFDDQLPSGRYMGSSGVIFGYMGMTMLRFSWGKVRLHFDIIFPNPWLFIKVPLWAFVVWKAAGDVFALGSSDGTAHLVHLSGFFSGMALAWAFGLKRESRHEVMEKSAEESERRGWWKLALREYQELHRDYPDKLDYYVRLTLIRLKMSGGSWSANRHESLALAVRALNAFLGRARPDEALAFYAQLHEFVRPEDLPSELSLRLDFEARKRGLDLTMGHRERVVEIEKRLLACRDTYAFTEGAGLALQLLSLLPAPGWSDKTLLAAGEMLFATGDGRRAGDMLGQAAERDTCETAATALRLLQKGELSPMQKVELGRLEKKCREKFGSNSLCA